MVIWTPEQWGRELDEFAAATNEKRFNKIPYNDWKVMWGWQNLLNTTGIYLKISANGDFICSPYGELNLIIFERKANCPFLDYLQSKYYAILGYAESCFQYSIASLVQPHLTTDMTYANSQCNTVVNTNYSTLNSNIVAASNISCGTILSPEMYQTVIKEEKKEKEDMNFFKNFKFGPVKDDTVRLSPYGLAVKNLDGSWVAYDGANDSIIDVDVFNFEGKNLIYKIPAAPHTIHAGDMIVHQGKGMYVVADVCEGDTCVSVIDPRAGESKEILFTKSPFGFTFIVKLVSLLDMSGINANPDNPFGNLWPLALMDDKNCDAATMMAFMMMNNSEGCGFDMSNPMMMFALMSGDNKDMLLPMMLMAGRK